ncbi:MAG: 4Fe-4S binding protein, partial [Firmicutes bacterium]|nr:4Fe-4S binding protein [Bacillota bacterium]
AVKIPVFVKLTVEAVDPVKVARKVQEKGASGITAINRLPALEIDLKTGRPILHSTFAGVNGPWMRPIMLKWVAKIAREIDIPISATNGIWNFQDVVKAIMAGASTVQTCTALMYSPRGYKKIGDFIQGLKNFMVSQGYQSVKEMRGITLNQILTWDKVDRESRAVSIVEEEKCNGCQECQHWCFYEAISYSLVGGKQKASIESKKCDGCGLCASLCPKGAIFMEGPVPIYLGDFN